MPTSTPLRKAIAGIEVVVMNTTRVIAPSTENTMSTWREVNRTVISPNSREPKVPPRVSASPPRMPWFSVIPDSTSSCGVQVLAK